MCKSNFLRFLVKVGYYSLDFLVLCGLYVEVKGDSIFFLQISRWKFISINKIIETVQLQFSGVIVI
jgi:hypothetical protein